MRYALVLLTVTTLSPVLSAAIAGADNPKAYTEHDYRRAMLEFNRRTLVDRYRAIGKRDPKWDTQAEAFLDAMAISFSSGGATLTYALPAVATTEQGLQLGRAALDAGCPDPLVRYCHAVVLEESGKTAEASAMMAAVAAELDQSQYPLNRSAFAWTRLARLRRAQNAEDEAVAAETKFWETAQAIIVGWDFRHIDRRILFVQLWEVLNALPVERQGAFYDAVRQLPGADPWIMHTIGGAYYLNAAWKARGGGWASGVDGPEWKEFFELSRKARDCLAAAWKLHPDYPEPAAIMIRVAVGAGDRLSESPREWFDRAISAQFDHWPAYENYLWNLLPAWHGSFDAMHAFGLECLRTGRYDTRVPWVFVYAMDQITQYKGDASYWQRPGAYEDAKEYFSKQAAAQPGTPVADWCRSYQAAVSWKNGRFDEARKLLDEIRPGEVARDPFDKMGSLPGLVISYVHATTGPHADATGAAEQIASTGDTEGAAAAYRAIVEKLAPDDPAASFIRGRAVELALEKRYRAGEWIDIQPGADLACWYPLGGAWEVDDEGRLVGTADASGQEIVFHAGFLGEAYEMEGVVEFPVDKPRANGAGAIFAHAPGITTWGINLRRAGAGEAMVMFGPYRFASKPAPIGPRCMFGIKFGQARVTAMVEQDVVLDGIDLSERMYVPRRTYVGVSGYLNKEGVILRFSNLRVRKGSDGRPAKLKTPEAKP